MSSTSLDERHSSNPPPPPPPSTKPVIDTEWRPGAEDSSLRAADHRARRALLISRENRAENKELRDAIKGLASNVESLTSAVTAVKKLVGWAIGIVGAIVVVDSFRMFWVWLTTLHH